MFQGKALKTGILRQTATWRQGVATLIGQLFVMFLSGHRLGQKKDFTGAVNHEIVFEGMLFFCHYKILVGPLPVWGVE